MRFATILSLALLLGTVSACDGDEPSADAVDSEEALDLEGETVDPPFAVTGEGEGLLLAWFDEEGLHTVESRTDIPEARRERVRVDSLRLAPDERLDPDYVYVADLRSPGEGGAYAVRKLRRDAFDALVDRETGDDAPVEVAAVGSTGDADADVIIYGASWCGACRSAESFLRQRGVAFVERDIEEDPAALAEMQQKARAAGIQPTGIPVIDFRGEILTGFDRRRMEQLLAEGAQPI